MYIKIEDERVSSFARTDDAVKAFTNAVNNGQARFAMEVLVTIIEYLTSENSAEENKDTPSPEKESVKNEVKAPAKAPQKTAPKEEKADIED